MAEPGEFTKLALKNGKINLLKAESIGDLISSETDLQMKQALKVIAGKNLKKFETWREDVLKVLSNIEAKIDFPDEDLPKEILNDIKKKTDNIIHEMEASLQDNKVGQIIRDGFKIAIIGPPNVGKSSLLNYLSNRDVAIVSEIAGTTRDVIETHLNINGYPVIISDTAGIREAKDEIEKKGIKLSLKKADEADLNIIIIEAKSKENRGFLDKYINEKTLLVVNKIDKESNIISSDLKKLNPILVSIKNQKNIDVLINLIKDKIKSRFLGSENVLITRARHRENLEDCLKNLKKFKNKNDINDFDKAAEDLRLATRSLGKITGKVDVEEILDSIFNDFCIGK
jgi:tRNA modification GTPase